MARPGWMTALALAFALVAAPVFGQGGTSSATLSGVVVDKDGGLVPGATVTVKNVATGEALPIAVTNATGGYSFPNLPPGTYKVTVTLSGFKTNETEVRLQAGTNNNISTKLEVGRVEEVVTVTAGTELVRTNTPTVTQTVNSNFIQTLPRSDRNALSFLVFLPGVTTTGTAGGYRNNSTIAGLPNNTFNITIDGVSNSNMLQSGDGFFSLVVPRLDAVEEVSLTTSSAGADASGQGAVQIRFVTRSGTNKFEVSAYEFFQHKALNSNTFFGRLNGLPVPQATSHTYGGRVGGPIILPGFDGRGRAFFFFNQEEVYSPTQTDRSGRTFIRQSALDGNFTYGAVGSQNTVNVLALAAAYGQVNTIDPDVLSIEQRIRAAAASTGTIQELVTTPNTATHAWLVPTKSTRHTPTTNITVNLTPKNRLQGSYYWQRFFTGPDTLNTAEPVFPGLTPAGEQDSFRTTASISLRSTISTAVVNEVRGGWQWSPVNFFKNITAADFAWMGNYAVNQGFGLTNIVSTFANGPSARNTANYTLSDQINWLKGSHSFTFGGDWTRVDDWNDGYQVVPTARFGLDQTFDPAELAGMFASANFPGSSSSDRNNARALYALLTGRVTSIGASANLNNAGDEYVYNGHLYRAETMDEYSMYGQDTWRLKPTVTLTAGLRYQLQMPMSAKNGVFTTITPEDSCGTSGLYSASVNGGNAGTSTTSTRYICNLFNIGSFLNPGVTPQYIQYNAKTKGYNIDYNNVAPNVGISWRPNVQSGLGRSFLGDPELATVNAGWTRSYNRERLDQFLNVFNGNPGQSTTATRSAAFNAFPIVPAGESWPVLYREKDRLGPPAFNPVPSFPIAIDNSESAWLFNPNIVVPYTDSWNVSIQRALTKDTVFEIRYQGNTGSRNAWTTINLNTVNVYDTKWLTGRRGVGFADGEFEKAQANLHANVLAGLGPTFAFTGAAGTVPLPILLAHLDKSTDAANPAAYKGTLWSNATFTSALDPYFPSPSGFANNLYGATSSASGVGPGASTRLFDNAVALGYPLNFWVLNPDVSEVDVVQNSDNRPLNHQVILQVRRRLADGLAVQASYTWSRFFSGSLLDLHLPRLELRSQGVPHAIQTLWTYDIPYGRGKRFGANINPWLDGVIGGWTFSGTARFQTQSFVLRNVVLSPGWTMKQAEQDMKAIRMVTDPVSGAFTVWSFPEEIYTNTLKAFNTDETKPNFYAPGTEPTGKYFAPAGGVMPDGSLCNFLYPGDCGAKDLWFLGRWFGEMDFRLAKAFQLPGKARFEMSAEVFNATKALNFPNQINPTNAGSSNATTRANTFRITSTQSPARTAQLVWRVSW